VSDVRAPQPGDQLRRTLQRLRAKRGEAPPTPYELALEKGAAGELDFGRALNEAAAIRGGCWVLHGLVLEGKRADIDHLVIGPAGVTAIDSKTWQGRVWIGRLGLGRGGRAYPQEIDGMGRQINRVHSRLAKVGRDDILVAGALCLVNENDGIPTNRLAEIRGVKVGHPRSVIDHALRDGQVDAAMVEIVARILSEQFVVHGGSQAPTGRPRPVASKRKPQPRVPRFVRRLALVVLGSMVALTGVAAIVAALDGSADRLTRPYRTFSRADLLGREATYRRIAVKRARGRVHGPKIRASPTDFVLAYRRAGHCRVVVRVSRAAPIVGGGKPTRVRSTGCRRHR
jgi:hypothetical protein